MKIDKKQIHNWLQLIRFPNLFTIPSDILLGYFVVSEGLDQISWRTFVLILISLMLYSGGLIMNDLFDYEEDRKERPERPLASGAIPIAQAQKVMTLLFAVAVAMSAIISLKALIFSSLLILTIYCYNGPLKKQGIVASVSMGLCRTFNVFLGASSWSGDWNFSIDIVAIVEGAYIVGICLIARNETVRLPKKTVRVFTFKLLAVGTLFLMLINQVTLLPFVLCSLLVYIAFRTTESIKDLPLAHLPRKIGEMIRNLTLISAAYVSLFAPAQITVIVCILLLYPLSQFFGKRFYAS